MWSKRLPRILRPTIKNQVTSTINQVHSTALIDTFERQHTYLRISLTERCNLRCQYCMPAEGVKLSENDKLLSSDEIIYLARIFAKEGVKKIRLTGGEPTVRKDLLTIIGDYPCKVSWKAVQVKLQDYIRYHKFLVENLKKTEGISTVAMTTNGLTLTRQLVSLQKSGLDIVNVSLDTLKPHKYEQITRRKGWERVMMGIDLALQLGYDPVKINCVMIKGFNDDEIIDFVKLTQNRNVDIRFIEYMPFSGNRWEYEKMIPYKQMLQIIQNEFNDFHALENAANDTSKAWKVRDYQGQIGFITSMSDHFCGTCNRLRITADGNLKVCLFGNTEVSLRDAIRNGCREDDLVALISAAVKRKKKQHAGACHQPKKLNARMYSTENKLSHVDNEGKTQMVDISTKDNTIRTAKARATVLINYETSALIRDNLLKKGDVLSVAQLAGIMATKKTSELIPLCHNIPLTHVEVDVQLLFDKKVVEINSTVKTVGKTGAEMEALIAVSVAALTVYDMCKSVGRDITITNASLVGKCGGKSGTVEVKKQTEDFRNTIPDRIVFID